jgi:uncharacterized protein involved in response to NO
LVLGASQGAGALLVWFASQAGKPVPGIPGDPLWHGHEMVFGFFAAIISGLLLTALPSWAGVPEQRGGTLAWLVAAWLGGRFAMVLAPVVSPALVALVDCGELLLLAAVLAPGLIRARSRKFCLLLPVLAALAAANVAFHAALAMGERESASAALVSAVAIVVVLYSLVGGFMTPVFTNNALREQGSAARALRHRRMDVVANGAAIAFAVAQAAAAPARMAGAAAAVACIVHAARLALWRGWHVRGHPLVSAMHAGYAWLVAAFAVEAFSAFTAGASSRAWLHAFTIGAVGTMMLALMPRVALRHTGRAIAAAPLVAASCVAMTAAALLRLAFGHSGVPAWTGVVAAGLWATCFVGYTVVYAPMLWRPSLPRPALSAPLA